MSIVDLTLKGCRARVGRAGLVHVVLDEDAPADGAGEEENAERDGDHRQSLLVLVLAQDTQLPLVVLPRRHLRETRLRFGLHTSALDRGFLQPGDLRLPSLLFEGPALPIFLVRPHTRFLLVLLASQFAEASLLLVSRSAFRFDLLLFLAILRIAQDLLNGDHHRGFLPFRHDVSLLLHEAVASDQ